MAQLNVLNLGAGVQSTTLYLMFLTGELQPQIDAAIFADTQEEPAAVYRHLEWLESLGGPRILRRTKSRLGDDLARGENSTGQRFAVIPAYTRGDGDELEGQTRRQCSKEYKVDVIERTIRRELLGLQPGRRAPRGTVVHQYIGISMDEAGRAKRLRERMADSRWLMPHFPLIDKWMTRGDCLRWLERYGVPHTVPRSACTFCPYHSDAEWEHLRATDPEGWKRAVYIDGQLRVPGNIVNRNMEKSLYLHRSCQPLGLVQLQPKPPERQMSISFWAECEGVCGV